MKTFTFLSTGIVKGFEDVVSRKFKLSKTQQEALTKFLIRISNVVKVKSQLKVVEDDPSDDMILRTAYDGEADYIFSGDNHLLTIKEFKGIKIVTVSEMLKLLK
ncbi:MAG: putative toxin-antitoxin system toxin component, PIN family [Candidatus Bathyarchaeia archaeon]|nr:putative toxin-antitoxin system toxin component, PIN family [Candidatus Bathyarchaeota archaeon]